MQALGLVRENEDTVLMKGEEQAWTVTSGWLLGSARPETGRWVGIQSTDAP